MDNVKNGITAKVKESEVNTVEDNWVVLNWNNKQKANEEITQSSESQKDLDDEIRAMQTKNDGTQVPCINANSDDTFDNISIQSSETQKNSESKNWIMQLENRGIAVLCKDAVSDDISDQSTEIQEDLDNGIQKTSTKNKVIKACTVIEPDDISDGISIITESDNANAGSMSSYEIYQPDTAYEIQKMFERTNKQIHILDVFAACLLGVTIGFILGLLCSTTIPTETYSNLNKIDTESFQTEIRNLIDACKDLKEVNAILSEIKTNIPVDKETCMAHIWQLLKSINHTNDKNDTFVMEPFNSNLYLLEQLQISMHVLSSLLGAIQGNNSSSRNEMDKALDVVNNTKAFYETLILSNKSTQNVDNSVTMQFLQSASGRIHYTSQSLLSDLFEKISKITLHVYNKYNKVRRKLGKELCHLKNSLPDGSEFLKESIENSKFLRNYDKSCFSNNTSKKFNGKTSTKGNITAETLLEGEYQAKAKRPKQEDSFKWNNSIKKTLNDNNTNIEREKLFLYDKMENRILKPPNNHCESKFSLCNSYTVKQDNQQIKSTDWQFQRSRAREQLRQPVKSDGYFSRDNQQIKSSDWQFQRSRAREQLRQPVKSDSCFSQDNQQIKSADWQFQRSRAREQIRQPVKSDSYFSRDQSSKVKSKRC